MATKPEPKPINTLADLLADLAEFTGDPTTTKVFFFDGAEAWPLQTLQATHHSAPGKFAIWIERRFDREFALAHLQTRLREAEADVDKMIGKLDRNRQRLKTAVQLRDQYKTLLAGK